MLAVANAYYAGGDEDLVVWDVDESALTAQVRWEPPDPAPPPGVAAGVLFPHVYGPIERRAVVRVRRLVAGRPAGRRTPATRRSTDAAGRWRPASARPTRTGPGRPRSAPRRPGRPRRPDGAPGTGRARRGAGRGRDGGPRPGRARRPGSARPRRRTGRPGRGGRGPRRRRSSRFIVIHGRRQIGTNAVRSAAARRRDRRPGAQRTERLPLLRRPLDLDRRGQRVEARVDVVHGLDVGDVQPQPGGRERVRVGEPVLLVVHDDEVGRQRDDRGEVGVLRATDRGQLGVLAEAGHRDRADRPGQQRLRDRGDQADDAGRRARLSHPAASASAPRTGPA